MKKLIVSALIVVAIGLGLFMYHKKSTGDIRYKASPVTSGYLQSKVTATGTVNAVTTVLVGTQVSGTIKKLHVDFNSKVKVEQTIAEIDPAGFQAQVDQARANVMVARANVEKARTLMEDSKRTFERNRQLFTENLIARSDLDTAEANFNSNNALLLAAQAQTSQTEAALRYAENNLKYTRIVSPVDGIVVSRSVDVGQTVAASFQTPTLFTIAQDLTKMQIDTNIDEADIGRIQTGQKTEFTVDAYPEQTFHGVVEQIRIAPTTVQNVVTYDVVVKVDNADLKLKPGMTANVSVITASKENILKIPNSALRFKPPAEAEIDREEKAKDKTIKTSQEIGHEYALKKSGDQGEQQSGRISTPRTSGRITTLWVLDNEKPRKIQVTTGISDGSYTEIMSGPLTEGQQVIVGSSSKSTGTKGNDQQQRPPMRILR